MGSVPASIVIRDMKAEDYDSFVRFYTDLQYLHSKSMPDTFRSEVGIPPREAYENELQRPEREFFLAEVNGIVAGMCDTDLKTIPDDLSYPLLPCKIVQINDLYVSPEFRRQGVATALYREAERRGRALGADKMNLMVWGFNENALEFYRHVGMEISFYQMEIKL